MRPSGVGGPLHCRCEPLVSSRSVAGGPTVNQNIESFRASTGTLQHSRTVHDCLISYNRYIKGSPDLLCSGV